MKIKRTDLIKNPQNFGIDLGKNPQSKLYLLETQEIIPPCIKVGGEGDNGHLIKGYYPPIIIKMIKKAQDLKKYHKYAGIRIVIRKKYRSVFEIMDILTLRRLYFFDNSLLSAYLDKSTISEQLKWRISDLYDKDLTFKEIKLGILDIVSDINI